MIYIPACRLIEEWNGMEWNGMERNGTERNGMDVWMHGCMDA